MRIVQGKALDAAVRKLVRRGIDTDSLVEKTTARIVSDVTRDGDLALRRYSQRLDGLLPRHTFRVPPGEIADALAQTSSDLRHALEHAAANIRQFSRWQMPQEFLREAQPGVRLGQVVRAVESVGCYVPGGRFPLPSSLLMSVVPAQVAGVPRIAIASPRPSRETLAAAALLGIDEVYRIGGAQAIAALAFGTRSVPPVDKVVGPGNAYVTAAKRLVAFQGCGIDFAAGPTEIVYLSDDGEPAFTAADLVAQAEHDPDALAIFITASLQLAWAVDKEVSRRVRGNGTAHQALTRNGVILVAQSHAHALDISNAIAPEHITVGAEDVAAVCSAGSIFVGGYSPQALGDYGSGPNHVLPTAGVARCRGGLSVLDFLKIITVQEVSCEGLRRLAPAVETLATAEGLAAHAESVRTRYADA